VGGGHDRQGAALAAEVRPPPAAGHLRADGLGEPAEGYPWHWGVYQWLEGRDALAESVTDSIGAARALAGFVRAMQAVDTLGGPVAGRDNNYRGVALHRLDARVRESLAQLEADIDTAAAARLWEDAVDAPQAPAVWIHGDLLPGNLLVRDGRLAGVIDFGLLGVGDPSADLMAAWTTFGGEARAAFIEAAGADGAAWRRARGWAFYGAAVALPYYRDINPVLARISRRTLEELLG
jgi:aminoglycoside phosphotransferase (APT) family kinase protein